MFFALASRLIITGTTLFPIYASYKALKSNDVAKMETLLMFWAVAGCIMTVENTVEWVINWSVHDALDWLVIIALKATITGSRSTLKSRRSPCSGLRSPRSRYAVVHPFLHDTRPNTSNSRDQLMSMWLTCTLSS